MRWEAILEVAPFKRRPTAWHHEPSTGCSRRDASPLTEVQSASVVVLGLCHVRWDRVMTSARIMEALSGQSDDPAEPDQSLQHMLKAIADERNRLTVRQDLSGLGQYIQPSTLTPRACHSSCPHSRPQNLVLSWRSKAKTDRGHLLLFQLMLPYDIIIHEACRRSLAPVMS